VGDRVPTGITGFDRLVGGGLPRGTVNLLAGPAGSGKSLFGLQFIYNGATRYGDPGLYLVLEETRENVERAVQAYGMEFEGLERSGQLLVVDMGEVRAGDPARSVVSFDDLRDFLAAALPRSRVKRLVIDSLSAIGLYYASSEQLRERLFTFARFLRSQDVTALMITESLEGGSLTRYDVEQFVSDSFIHLGLEDVMGDLRRTLTVRKMRFTRHDSAKHPVHITSSGIVVMDQEKVV